MRTRLFLSAAVTTLSLCLAPAYAQNAPHEKPGGEAKQGESVPRAAKPGESQGAAPRAHQQGERATERERERNEAREAQKPGEPGQKAEGQKADKADKAERHSGTKKGERHGAADDARSPTEQGAQRGPDTRQDTTPGKGKQGARGPGEQERTGEAQPRAEDRSGAAGLDRDQRGRDQRAGTPERRGENDMGADQRTRGAFDRNQPDASRPGGREAAGGVGRDERGQRMRVGAREQGQIRQIIEQRGGRRLSPNAFDLRVGVIAPPNVPFLPLPPDVVAIAPQFQGFNYAMVGDDIAIIDPSSREVVSVLNEGGPPPATYGYEEHEGYRGGGYEGRERLGAGPREERGERGAMRRDRRGESYGYAPRVRLDNRQERALYRGLIGEARENLRQVCVRVGERVPESVDIEPVPRAISAETPDVERFDYFVLNDQVVLVDPDSRIVVDIIPAPR